MLILWVFEIVWLNIEQGEGWAGFRIFGSYARRIVVGLIGSVIISPFFQVLF